jgi:hypothetical protein
VSHYQILLLQKSQSLLPLSPCDHPNSPLPVSGTPIPHLGHLSGMKIVAICWNFWVAFRVCIGQPVGSTEVDQAFLLGKQHCKMAFKRAFCKKLALWLPLLVSNCDPIKSVVPEWNEHLTVVMITWYTKDKTLLRVDVCIWSTGNRPFDYYIQLHLLDWHTRTSTRM